MLRRNGGAHQSLIESSFFVCFVDLLVLFCFVLFCFVLFCFVLFCFVFFVFVWFFFHPHDRRKNWSEKQEKRQKRVLQVNTQFIWFFHTKFVFTGSGRNRFLKLYDKIIQIKKSISFSFFRLFFFFSFLFSFFSFLLWHLSSFLLFFFSFFLFPVGLSFQPSSNNVSKISPSLFVFLFFLLPLLFPFPSLPSHPLSPPSPSPSLPPPPLPLPPPQAREFISEDGIESQ